MFTYASYLRPIFRYACMMWSYAAKSHVKLLIKVQNSTIRQILDMPWHIQNFHFYKVIYILRLNNYMQHRNLNFLLAWENINNRALNILIQYDYNNPINRKSLKTGLRLNTLLLSFSYVTNLLWFFTVYHCFVWDGVFTPPCLNCFKILTARRSVFIVFSYEQFVC